MPFSSRRPIWRELYARVRHAIEGGMRQRLTRAGFFFSLLTALAGSAAFITANNILYLLFALLISSMLISGFISRLSLAGLELEFLPPEHVTARRSTPARLRMSNAKSWVPSFSLTIRGVPLSVRVTELYIPYLPAASSVEAGVDVRFAHRGLHEKNSFRLVSRFPFGFTERRIDLTLANEVVVYPSLEPHPESERRLAGFDAGLDAFVRSRGTDFYRIRPYEIRESARHVDWKATAHTGDLQVREFAAEREPLIEIILDPNVPAGSEPLFERAVECCAFLCWQIAHRPARLRLRCGSFDRTLPAECDIYTVLRFLALVQPSVLFGTQSKAILNAYEPDPPLEADSLRLILTASPQLAMQAGWQRDHVLDLHTLDPGSAEHV
ncbi:MAG: DUF58 domain-containing protein [Bryobacterales bacterium]|nr:DUF58 domain-containing protein [Bryobacterales bacterium]